MSHKEDFWNKHYNEVSFENGKAPASFLVEMLPRLQKGKVLDIGMGEGVNAVYLAQKGFSVKGVDLSEVAISHAEQLAKETGVTIETKKADLDLFIFGLLEYDTILMTHFKPSLPRYYSEIIRALKQGGTLLIESLGQEEIKEALSPEDAYKNWYFKSNEILHHLKGMKILFYQEGIVNNRHIVQCVAQKPADKDAAKYQLFDMQSASKDSGPSAQHKLAEALFKKKIE